MYIIGFSFGYHDSSVTILKEGRIVGVYSEERFSRKKHDKSFPEKALQYAIKYHSISSELIDSACYYEDPILKLSRIEKQFLSSKEFVQYLSKRSNEGKLYPPLKRIANALSIDINKTSFVEHHESHLFNSLSLIDRREDQLEEYISINIDGVGELITSSIYAIKLIRKEIKIDQIGSSIYPNSLGLFYSAITTYLGFEANDAEFKVLGLAGYGKPIYKDEFDKILTYSKETGIKLDKDYFNFSPSSLLPYSYKFIEKFGSPASSSSEYAEEFTTIDNVLSNKRLTKFANIASSAQACLTSIVKSIFKEYSRKTTMPILFSGGVALNTKANYNLLKSFTILVSPDPGDGGSSLGAASANYFNIAKDIPKFVSPYLGYDISDDNVKDILIKYPNYNYKEFSSIDQLYQVAVQSLINENVIGWAQDRAEFGPRALGTRSILADPSKKESQLFVNKTVKFREPFRPFAPAVLEEYLDDLFETEEIQTKYKNNPLNYMLTTLPVKKLAYTLIPACIHVDGTSRVQVVTKNINPKFYKLIKEFHKRTGVPALLNTSFNLRGYPIINNAIDALSTFDKSGMKSLFINKIMINK